MVLIHFLQRFAAAVSARDAAAMMVLAATIGIAVFAFFRSRSALRQHRFALGAMALGALTLVVAQHVLIPTPMMVVVVLAVFGAFTLHTLAERRSDTNSSIERASSRGQTTVWIGGAVFLFAFFAFSDLGGYAGSLMVWEPEAMTGLVEATRIGTSLPRFAAQRLLWDDGVISTSHHSLLYGSGTFALWRLAGASITTLRLASVLLALACLPVGYFIGKKIGGSDIATATVVVLSLNPVLLFYGRYGISIAGSLFAVLLALLVCERLADPDEGRWWMGLAAAAAAYLATLGYSPARVVTLALVTLTVFFGVRFWPQQSRGRRTAIALMLVSMAGVWFVQTRFNTARTFIAARGEQVFTISQKPVTVKQLLDDQIDPEQLTTRQRLTISLRLIARTLPELKSLLSFSVRPIESPWHVIRRDPPDLPLIQGPLLLLAMWGFILSIASWRDRWPIFLLAVLAAATLPILLTTRADIHRLSLTSLPVVVWAAMGASASNRIALACGVSKATRNAGAAILVILIAAFNSTYLYYPHPPTRSPLVTGIRSEINSISQPLAVGLDTDPNTKGEIQVDLCNRQWRHRLWRWELLSQETVDALTGRIGAPETAIEFVETMRHRATVLLAPREPFAEAVEELSRRGVRVRSFGTTKMGWWRIDRVASSFVISNDPSVQTTAGGNRAAPDSEWPLMPKIPLDIARVLDAQYGFKAPRFNAAYDGRPITMDGATYSNGIGMHAWTHIWFEVPLNAFALEATIGLSDTASECDPSLVTFEVWNDKGTRIFDSGPFRSESAPRRIHVPLDATASVELVLTEGGDGRDCDHGNWGEPVFVLDR